MAFRLLVLPVQSLSQDLQLSRKLVAVRASARVTGRIIDAEALDTLERRIVDDGDLLPSWASWWLSLAAELAYNASWSACSALIVSSHSSTAQNPLATWLVRGGSAYKVMPLMVENMCDALTLRAWSAGFAIAWGVNGADFNNPTLPISCQGAILPVVDGMAVLCITTEEDRSALAAWLGNEDGE